MAREVELSFEVRSSVADAIRVLQALAAPTTKEIVDVYFTHPGIPSLLPRNGHATGHIMPESFRIRRKDGRTCLTWKREHLDGDTFIYADEEEVEVESFEKIEALIKSLGFQHLITVETMRTAFHIGEYEIVIDDVKDLGVLLEIECRDPKDRPAEEIGDEMRAFLKTAGVDLGEEQSLGKPELLLRKRQGLYIN